MKIKPKQIEPTLESVLCWSTFFVMFLPHMAVAFEGLTLPFLFQCFLDGPEIPHSFCSFIFSLTLKEKMQVTNLFLTSPLSVQNCMSGHG